MREWHARHGRDGGVQDLDMPVTHARGQSRSPEPIRDSETRIREALEYRERVDAVYAAYKAGQLESHETRAERVVAESAEKPASRIDSRAISEHKEEARRQKPERSWLPSNETTQVAVSVSTLFSIISNVYHIMPDKPDAIAAGALGVVLSGVAWANKRWKDKHGDRPES
jgi:hypothetical protein